ncbi:MAG: cobalt-zinc-cadmium efflux system membrane fusion protein [Bacteroidia bacterium]|jgi:cobalt-zinc-cadmium efflux system membrane fusion protein
MKYIFVLFTVFLVTSCQQNKGHNHDAEGNHIGENTSDNVPRQDYTIWSSKSELFVEFPALIVGKQSKFAAHFTILDKHQAVSTGTVTVSLIQGKKGVRQTVNDPSSPGIFTPILAPTRAGISELQFILITEKYTDTLTVMQVQVFPDLKTAQEIIGKDEERGGNITFFKEQAWKMEFQTEMVRRKQVFESISTSGKWQISPGNSQTLIANANGNVQFRKKRMLSGESIEKGEVIMTISGHGFTSNNLNSQLEVAKADFLQAETEYERKKKLCEEKIVPQSEFEKVAQKYEVAKSQYEALSKGRSSSGFTSGIRNILAPVSGYLKQVNVVNGSFVNEGDELFVINNSKPNVLEIQVGAQHASKLKDIKNIWFRTYDDQWCNLDDQNGMILSIDQSVSTAKPNISVYAQVKEEVNMPQGGFSEVTLSIGEGITGILISESALMEDYGKYSVIVQLSGESFERRNVLIGNRNGGEIEIVSGLKDNEVIVTKGAYQVKMQAMSGQAPPHGHAH